MRVRQLRSGRARRGFRCNHPIYFFAAGKDKGPRCLGFSAIVDCMRSSQVIMMLPSPGTLASVRGTNRVNVRLCFSRADCGAVFGTLSAIVRTGKGQLTCLQSILLNGAPINQHAFFPVHFP